MELGFFTLGDLLTDIETGVRVSHQQKLNEIIDAGVLTETLGFDAFAIGEHHDNPFVVSAPPVILGNLAARTQRIRLSTAVTLTPNLHPIRVAEDYATVDLLSDGRLDIVVGKGNFPSVFGLFDQNLSDQRALQEEHIALLLKAWQHEHVDWTGKLWPQRAVGQVLPRPKQEKPPIWLGAASGRESGDAAARNGLSLFLAAVVRPRAHLVEIADHYRGQWAKYGHAPKDARVALASKLYIEPESQKAKARFRNYFNTLFGAGYSGKEGLPVNMPATYEEMVTEDGPLFVGSPDEIVDKFLAYHEAFGHHRHMFQIEMGGMPYKDVANVMELFASKVAGKIHKSIGAPAKPAPEAGATLAAAKFG